MPESELADALQRADAAECLAPDSALDEPSSYAKVLSEIEGPISPAPDWRFDPDEALRGLCEHFRVAKLDGFGLGDMQAGIGAAGAVLHYLQETQRGAVQHVTSIKRVARGDRLILDRTSRRSLEVVETQRDGARKGSLLWVLDRTHTPMGARRLKT